MGSHRPEWDADLRRYVGQDLTLEDLANLLIEYQRAKDRGYNKSWARRGFDGYRYGCILRETDRLEGVLQEARLDAGPEDAKVAVWDLFDTLVDVSLYAMMGIQLMALYWPGSVADFMEAMRKYIDERTAGDLPGV